MDLQQIYTIATTVLTIVGGALSIYLRTSEKAKAKAKEVADVLAEITAKAIIFIKEAEESYKDVSHSGGQKFEEVVDKLYDLVPDALHGIFTKDMIGQIVQSTFDEIEAYAKVQLDRAMDKIEVKQGE